MTVKSAERVLAVIDYLTMMDNGVTLMELSNSLKIPKSSMSKLLGTMLDKNYLVKSDGNFYKLGHKLIVAGNKARTSNDIYSASIAILKDAVIRTGETLFLAIRSSDEIIYLAKVDSENSPRTTAQPGMRKPLHCTGLGKTFLSFETSEIRQELLKRIPLEAHAPGTITDRKELEEVTVKYRQQGYAVDDEESEEGVFCIAAPIFNDSKEIIAAVSCAGNKERMLKKRNMVVNEIVGSAEKISKTQGFSSEFLHKDILLVD